ncbi:hypothetical protein MSAN_01178100 [Mycena sanguinolenta]|uniref:Uncharacterized protein n=1 Tax=Mycena sanguinolenta TaxID=230812 RepID=A0A8H7D4S5_9AGAR|nr:hypothetical protein MSAN_01178100 [Mycena sanguinolenta]
MPEFFTVAFAVYGAYQGLRKARKAAKRLGPPEVSSPDSETVPDDAEDADLARAIAQSLQEMELQQRPRLDILPTVVNTAATPDDPDDRIFRPHSPATVPHQQAESNWEARPNEEFFPHSFEHSTSRYDDDLGEDALQPLGPLGASLIIAGQVEGQARVRHTGGEGGRGEGLNLGQMSFHNSYVNLIINGGTGGDGGAAGTIAGGTGLECTIQIRSSSLSSPPPLPPRRRPG